MSKTQKPAETEVDEAPAADPAADTTALVAQVKENPVIVFQNPDSLEAYYSALEARVKAHVPDLTTATGRKKISALAFEVAKAKTSLDDAGKELNAEKRAEINKVDEARRSLRERFDDLRDLARQPLTDWEQAEDRRKVTIQRDLAGLREAGLVFNDDTLDELRKRMADLEAMTIDADRFGEHATEAEGRRTQAIAALKAGIDRAELEELREAEMARQTAELEAQRAELAEMRRLQAEREQRDAEKAAAEQRQRDEDARLAREKEAAELAQKAAAEAAERAAEQRRIDEEEAAERIRQAAEAAERRAREEAAAEAERQRLETEQRHAAELKRIEDEAAQRERDRLAEIERERLAREAEEAQRQEEARLAALEEERRQADKKHRAKIKRDVVAAILAEVPAKIGGSLLAPVDDDHEAVVAAIVEAIAAGKITRTTIQF